jgi:hypothetical protein
MTGALKDAMAVAGAVEKDEVADRRWVHQKVLGSGDGMRLRVDDADTHGPGRFLVWRVADVGIQIEWKSGFNRFVLIDLVNPDQMTGTESVHQRESLQNR